MMSLLSGNEGTPLGLINRRDYQRGGIYACSTPPRKEEWEELSRKVAAVERVNENRGVNIIGDHTPIIIHKHPHLQNCRLR